MAIFGYICLVLFTIYCTVATLGGVYAAMGFSGKFPKESIPFLIFEGAMWYLTYVNFPFTVTMK